MKKQFSMAQARQSLSQILDRAEKGESAEITRRGKAVAVVIPIEQYREMAKTSFWKALSQFRLELEKSPEGLMDVFNNICDNSVGREVNL